MFLQEKESGLLMGIDKILTAPRVLHARGHHGGGQEHHTISSGQW